MNDLFRAHLSLKNVEFRKRLIAKGIMPAQIDAKIAEITNESAREIARMEWEYSDSISRMHPMVIALAPAFGFTEEQLDELFL